MAQLTKAPDITIAANLLGVQEQIKFLQEREDELKSQLLENLKKQGVRSVRLSDGSSYTIAERSTLKVVDEAKAKEWLDEHYCWKADTAKALQILKRELKMPKFFKRQSTEYLTIKRNNKEN